MTAEYRRQEGKPPAVADEREFGQGPRALNSSAGEARGRRNTVAVMTYCERLTLFDLLLEVSTKQGSSEARVRRRTDAIMTYQKAVAK